MVNAQSQTYADLLNTPDDGFLYELVRGEILRMPPPKGQHGFVEIALAEACGRYLYARALALGWTEEQGLPARGRLVGHIAGGEAGIRFSLPDDPDQVRGVDLFYLTPEQVSRFEHLLRDEYIPTVPALVVEVISPSESANRIDQKVWDYLAGGAEAVWLLYPRTRTAHVYGPDGSALVIPSDSALDGGAVLPGFTVSLCNLFP